MDKRDFKVLISEKERYQKQVTQAQSRIDSILYEYNSCLRKVNDMRIELQEKKEKHKKYKRKTKSEYKKMKLKLLEEILILKSILYDKEASKIINYEEFLEYKKMNMK
jgi:hypothetical protein